MKQKLIGRGVGYGVWTRRVTANSSRGSCCLGQRQCCLGGVPQPFQYSVHAPFFETVRLCGEGAQSAPTTGMASPASAAPQTGLGRAARRRQPARRRHSVLHTDTAEHWLHHLSQKCTTSFFHVHKENTDTHLVGWKEGLFVQQGEFRPADARRDSTHTAMRLSSGQLSAPDKAPRARSRHSGGCYNDTERSLP